MISCRRLFGAGFYYKTFMGPNLIGKNWAWTHVYEPAIRRAAGLGVAPREPDPDRYQRTFAHCDVLIVGAGPAGLAAALAASESGARVVVCDENPAPGGSLLAETEARIESLSAREWLAKALAALRDRPNLRLMTRTQAFGYYAQNFVALNERLAEGDLTADPDLPRERLWQMRAREVVLATGAIERPLVFPDNDRPGVMLADAARRYCNQYGVKVGERVVVATAHDGAYRAALDLKAAGVNVALIADLRREAKGPLPEAARAAGVEVVAGAEIAGVDGRLRVKAVRVSVAGATRTVACDALLMSGGWTPSVHLFSQSRGKLVFDEALQVFKPGASAQRERSAGACNATFDLAGALAEGDAAGRAAALRRCRLFLAPCGGGSRRVAPFSAIGGGALDNLDGLRDPPPSPAPRGGGRAEPPRRPDRRAKAFVDFQNDVCAKDVSLAVQEGMRSIEHIKRYTTTGMATDQGKLSNMNALAIAAAALAKPIPDVGLTTFRPPYTPVTFGAFAGSARGDLFDPIRRTPIHDWAAENGARFEDVGLWKRAWYFPRGRRIDARRGRARMPDDAGVRRPVRRLDARQDRGRRPRCGDIPRAHVRQRVPEARSRPLPLRPDAERSGLSHRRRGDRAPRARPLPRHDHDRRRAARARPDGGLSPDRVHRAQGLAHFDHRAMGDHRGAGTPRAGDDRPPHRRARPCERGLCRT